MSVLDDWSLLRLSAAGESMLTVSAVPFRGVSYLRKKGMHRSRVLVRLL